MTGSHGRAVFYSLIYMITCILILLMLNIVIHLYQMIQTKMTYYKSFFLSFR